MLIYIIYIAISPFLFFFLHIIRFFNPKINRHFRLYKKRFKKTINVTNNNRDKEILIFHAASAGEFEQIKPILNALKNRKKYFIIQTFTSPTVYEKEKDNTLFDICCYHPYDFLWLSYKFFKNILPSKYIITRHDVWPIHLLVCKYLNIPCYYINANIHPQSIWLYKLIRKFSQTIFSLFKMICVPSNKIKNRLESVCNPNVRIIVTGDTRFDQILDRAKTNNNNLLPKHYQNTRNIIFGSFDNFDEKIILNSLEKIFKNGDESLSRDNVSILLVPHEINKSQIGRFIKNLSSLSFDAKLYSNISNNTKSPVLVIDKVGILADLYKLCTFAYVGSGFTSGVHSVIEPAVYGCTIGFGPKFNLLDEARNMYHENLCHIISSQKDMNIFISLFIKNKNQQDIQKKLNDFVISSKGATMKIINNLNL